MAYIALSLLSYLYENIKNRSSTSNDRVMFSFVDSNFTF